MKGTEKNMGFCLNTNKNNSKYYLIIYYIPSKEVSDLHIFFFIILLKLELGIGIHFYR